MTSENIYILCNYIVHYELYTIFSIIYEKMYISRYMLLLFDNEEITAAM